MYGFIRRFLMHIVLYYFIDSALYPNHTSVFGRGIVMRIYDKLYISGQWATSIGTGINDVVSPSALQTVARVLLGDATNVDCISLIFGKYQAPLSRVVIMPGAVPFLALRSHKGVL